ncbi:DUF456 domain-containing protein [Streptomyces sp. NPDC007861]|uniref:DUF456 domain-containing protein n=1 Tax=Streptomyces sp. NPDC007861 TaxID=3154893 RepID=UPI0033DD4B22
MEARQLVLVGMVMLLGLCGVLVPGVPGTWLVWSGVAWWSLHERTTLAWWVLVGATALLLVDQTVVWLLGPRRLRGVGITPRMALFAGAGALVGFVLLPVVGAVLGFVGGVYGSERLRLGGHGEAMVSTRTVMRAAGTSILVELLGCLLVAGVWVGAVIRG